MKKIIVPCDFRLFIWRVTFGWCLGIILGAFSGFVEWCACGDFKIEAKNTFLDIWDLR